MNVSFRKLSLRNLKDTWSGRSLKKTYVSLVATLTRLAVIIRLFCYCNAPVLLFIKLYKHSLVNSGNEII